MHICVGSKSADVHFYDGRVIGDGLCQDQERLRCFFDPKRQLIRLILGGGGKGPCSGHGIGANGNGLHCHRHAPLIHADHLKRLGFIVWRLQGECNHLANGRAHSTEDMDHPRLQAILRHGRRHQRETFPRLQTNRIDGRSQCGLHHDGCRNSIGIRERSHIFINEGSLRSSVKGDGLRFAAATHQ